MQSLKKKYYQYSKEEFEALLTSMKNDSQCEKFFEFSKSPYFFLMNGEISEMLLNLKKKQLEIDTVFNHYETHVQNEIIKKCFIEEIQSTNKTENIYSTRHDIFGLIQNVAEIKNKKVRSTVNSYMMLLEDMEVNTLEDICEVYDYLMDKAFDSKEDKPDGKLFRKNEVSITDGLEQIHKGFYPEQNIILGMKEFLALYLDGRKDIFLRMIICHFLLETIHPYYDGNGRLGRLLFSLQLYKEEHTVFSFCIAQSIYKQKSKYYKALSNGRDIHEFGCLNQLVMDMGEILIEGMDNLLSQLKENQNRYFELSRKDWNISFSISERKVFDLLLQASCFGMFGLSNSQIMSELQISKRTVISTIKKFRENNLLSETTLGKVTYHRIVNFEIDE